MAKRTPPVAVVDDTACCGAVLSPALDDDTAPERAALVHQLWRHPATQEALRRETANGWPPEYI